MFVKYNFRDSWPEKRKNLNNIYVAAVVGCLLPVMKVVDKKNSHCCMGKRN